MDDQTLKRAHHTIGLLQSHYNTLRQTTYKSVHDDIGSTLSAASIKAKVLVDQISSDVDKHRLSEIHALIKQTMEHVTALNKKLKHVWIPQGSDTFFESLKPELDQIQSQFPIQFKLEVIDRNNLKKQQLSTLTIMHEWFERYIQNAITRLASNVTIRIEISPTQIQWFYTDTSPLAVSETTFQDLMEKVHSLSAAVSIKDGRIHLTFPSKGDA